MFKNYKGGTMIKERVLSNNVYQLILDHQINQREMAEEIGLFSYDSLRGYLSRKNFPITHVEDIANYLTNRVGRNITKEELLNNENIVYITIPFHQREYQEIRSKIGTTLPLATNIKNYLMDLEQ